MTPPALQVQEICDHIVDFLREDHPELASCALVSPVFTTSAQRHIFHEISLIVSSDVGASKVARTSRVLHAVLLESLHLLRFIRRPNVAFDPDVLAFLTGVQFTHLETVFLCGSVSILPRDGTCTTSSLAALLLAAPSVRMVKLTSIVFEDIAGFGALFHQCTTSLDSISMNYVKIPPSPEVIAAVIPARELVKITTSQILNVRDAAWPAHPLCPLDFTALEELDVRGDVRGDNSPGILALRRAARSTLHTLRFDARCTTPILDLPMLKTLDVVAGFGNATPGVDVFSALAKEPVQFQLQHIRIRIAVFHTLDKESLRRLDTAIADLHFPLLTVDVLATRTGMGTGGLSSDELALLMRGNWSPACMPVVGAHAPFTSLAMCSLQRAVV
ncbi:hypothetical protein DFH06DRAFT_1291809 [Mycena polygramma]|nr:hypothetical protein DFH06DRAFT_1291809 [Mycena polygramma]